MKAWHFVAENRKLGYGDGRLVEVGQTYTVDCEPVLCNQGLHGSVRLIDALRYAPGPILCQVDITGQVQKGDDKIVGTSRKVLKMADISDQLREFSRKVAYDIWVKHFPDDPKNVVVKWLTTGDESLRDVA